MVALLFDQGRIHLLEYGVLAFIMSCVSQIGDLSASLIKRRYEVKDFASVLPGHGGLLDRIDSLLFILPIAFTFYYLYLGLGIGGVL